MGPQTEQLNLTNDRRVKTDQILLTNFTLVLQPISFKGPDL